MDSCNYLYNIFQLGLFIEIAHGKPSMELRYYKIKKIHGILIENGTYFCCGGNSWISFRKDPHGYLFYFNAGRFFPLLTDIYRLIDIYRVDIYRLDINKIKMKLIWNFERGS